MDASFSFFAEGANVFFQTLYGLSKIAILLLFLKALPAQQKDLLFLKNVLIAYWIGQSSLYIINAFLYDSYTEWLANFNNYFILIPIFTASLLLAIWKRKQ